MNRFNIEPERTGRESAAEASPTVAAPAPQIDEVVPAQPLPRPPYLLMATVGAVMVAMLGLLV